MIDASLPMLYSLVLATCGAIAVIAALRPIVRRYCGAVVVLLLWWILPLALAATAIPKHTISVVTIEPAPLVTTEILEQSMDIAAISAPAPVAFPWIGVGLATWLIGVAGTAGWLLRAQWRFTRTIRWKRDGRGALPAQSGPAVVGAISPRIALPADFHARYSADERRLILLHETIHLRRRDGLANLAMSVLLVLQWFNPLVHWAARALCRDQESACDAVVVTRNPNALRTYADALLKSNPEMRHLPLVCRWQAYHPTVERIAMLKIHRDTRNNARLAVALLLTGGSLAGALAYAATPATVVTVAAQTATAAAEPEMPAAALPASEPAPPVRTAPRDVPVGGSDNYRLRTIVLKDPLPLPAPPSLTAAVQFASGAPGATPAEPATVPPPPATPPLPAETGIVKFLEGGNFLVKDGLPAKSDDPESARKRPGPKKMALRLKQVSLQGLMNVLAASTGISIAGIDKLSSGKFDIARQDTALRDLLSVPLSCHGYALVELPTGFAIEKAAALPSPEDAQACIAEKLPANFVESEHKQGWEQNPMTLNFRDIDLQAFANVVADLARLQIVGGEQLKGIKVTVPKRTSTLGVATRLVFGCAGFSFRPANGAYAITKVTDVPPVDAINACIDRGLPDKPGNTPPSSAQQAERNALMAAAYDVALDVLHEGKTIASPRMRVHVGESFNVAVNQTTIDCSTFVVGAGLVVTCKAPPVVATQGESRLESARGRGGAKRVEFGKMESLNLDRVEGGTTLQFTVNKVES